jgi:hypothetical protein
MAGKAQYQDFRIRSFPQDAFCGASVAAVRFLLTPIPPLRRPRLRCSSAWPPSNASALALGVRIDLRLRVEASQKKVQTARDFGIGRETLYPLLTNQWRLTTRTPDQLPKKEESGLWGLRLAASSWPRQDRSFRGDAGVRLTQRWQNLIRGPWNLLRAKSRQKELASNARASTSRSDRSRRTSMERKDRSPRRCAFCHNALVAFWKCSAWNVWMYQ